MLSAGAVAWVNLHGFTLYWGDAESHLDIARRIVEARSTGYEQLGDPWLPLPHVLMLPFVIHDSLWRSGLAGAIPNAICFTLAALLLFASVRRLFGLPAAWCAMALFVLNPNALYLQSIPMTEAVFFAALMGILFFTTRYPESQSLADLIGTALMCEAALLTRYEGWILVLAVAVFILLSTARHRILRTLTFCVLASLGAAWWLFYNWWLSNNALDFYNGPNSAMAIQHGQPYPGHGNWIVALQYFLTAARLVTGWPLLSIGAIGLIAALARKAFWPVILLALWPLFIVWSMHSSAQPIHIPPLPPHSWYNTRYALSMLPLVAFGAGALAGATTRLNGNENPRTSPTADVCGTGDRFPVACPPAVFAGASAFFQWCRPAHRPPAMIGSFASICGYNPMPILIVTLASSPWLLHLDHENWITWKESEQNSVARRAWTHDAAAYLESHARPTDTFFTTFCDICGVFREAGIHFSRTLTWDDNPQWQAAVNRPDLFLWEDWAVAQRGDPVYLTIQRASAVGVHYDLATEIKVPGAAPVEIYRRHEYPIR